MIIFEPYVGPAQGVRDGAPCLWAQVPWSSTTCGRGLRPYADRDWRRM